MTAWLGSSLQLAAAIYGDSEWDTALDWMDVFFSDLDLISDILFCVEVKRYLQMVQSREWLLANNFDSSRQAEWSKMLEMIWGASVAFIVIPMFINFCWFLVSLEEEDGERRPGLVRKNIHAIHKIIGPYLLNPFFIMFYLLVHLVNILLIASSAERLAKILVPRHKRSEVEGINLIAAVNTFGFFFETFPQFMCQGYFLSICGPNVITIVSVSISGYRTVSSYIYKIFAYCFPNYIPKDAKISDIAQSNNSASRTP